MKTETLRRVEVLLNRLNFVLEAIEDLKKDRFYAHEIKYSGNHLYDLILNKLGVSFQRSTLKGADYAARQNNWIMIQLDTFEKFERLSEENKVKYLTALANFNTINLRENNV